jgi:hypothetical protein
MRSIQKKPAFLEASEDIIHVSILDLLETVLPKDATPAWHTPNGGKRGAKSGRMMKKLGTRAGFPDLAFLWRGKFYALEVKTSTGQQRVSQRDWEKHITDAGGYYEIVRSVEETVIVLKKWSVIK